MHVRRAQSLERQSPQSIIRTLSLPSLSPISSPELFPERTLTQTDPQDKSSQQQEKKAPNSAKKEQQQQQNAKKLCTIDSDAVTDHQLKKC